MELYWSASGQYPYEGDMVPGDSIATDEQITAWKASRPAPPPPTLVDLQAQLAALTAQINALVASSGN
jgi:hypothetical protein